MAGEETTNQGNIRPEFNSANSGLNLDQSINQIPKGALSYALNASVENFDGNAISYQNEPGNEHCLQFPEGYQLIGEHSIFEKNKHIFFLANPETGDSEIGYMDNNDCIYHTLVNAVCLNFNTNHPIHKVVHRITNCSTEIYWTDGFNPRRYLDIDNVPKKEAPTSEPCNEVFTNELDCNKLLLQPNFSIPQLEVIDVTTGGDLKAGTYQFAIQYSDVDGAGYSSYYSVTNPTPIANPQITTPNFDYQVGKAIDIEISNLDTTGRWQYFNLAVIKTINAIPSVELVGTYFIDAETKKITYTGQNQTQIRLSIQDIFEKFPYYEIAQDVTAVRDILVWDQLTSIDQINYQSIANQITLQWETYKLPADENYADELNATNLRGYLRDEVYAFEIVFLLKNGKQTDGFHIPGRPANANDLTLVYPNNADFIGEPDVDTGALPYWKIYNTATVSGTSVNEKIGNATPYQYGEFAYWESEERYPCNEKVWGELANQRIRHHKFPDVLVSPIFESALFLGPGQMTMQKNSVFPLGVRVDISQVVSLINSSGLSQEQKDNIEGFKIVRGDRSTNKSIVAKGMLRNVGKYEREGTEYYFPNYPYNDLREDPFLLSSSNAYTTEASEDSEQFCRNFTVKVLEIDGCNPFIIEYTDCNTGETATKESLIVGDEITFCSTDLYPRIIAGKGCLRSNTYKVYKFTVLEPDLCSFSGGFTYLTYLKYNSPFNTKLNPSWNPSFGGQWKLPCETECCDSCNPPTPDDNVFCEGPQFGEPVVDVFGFPKCTQLIYSMTPPVFDSGFPDYTLEEVESHGYDLCDPSPLDAFSEDDMKYRQVFNSPETSFGQPFLGTVLKLENVIYGAGKAHFVQVKDNAKYKLLTKEAQQDAIKSANDIGKITSPFNASAFFAAYQSYLTIYVNGITRRNYGWSFNSIASYDYFSNIDNAEIAPDGFLGVKQRELELAQYLIPGVQNVGDERNVNNFQRESSVYLKTTDKDGSFQRTYVSYNLCNQSVSVSQVFEYTNVITGLITQITVGTSDCESVDSLTYPQHISGSSQFTIVNTGTSSVNISRKTPPLLYPNQLAPVTDNSRFTLSSRREDCGDPTVSADCNNPQKELDIDTVIYYASLKNIFNNQWGQIYSYETIDTGFQRDIKPLTTPVYGTVFGGDTFISKFAYKTKLPFFIDNRVGAADDSDIFYDEIGNVAYPRYWHSARSVLSNGQATNGSSVNVTLTNFISIKAHNFDCPNSQGGPDDTSISGRTYYDGKMYMFAYGVPYFYCESSYNVDLRQAFDNRAGDFWPHVSTGIPDDWVQESYVSIANDNTYYYNVTFSKQNKENVFTHLPIDWSEDLCSTNFAFRAIYSDPQANDPDNNVNNWLIYRPVSYFDFPQNYGNLVSLDGIQNKAILARFENKSLLYNNLLTIDTSNPQAAYIGNDKLFSSAPPIDFAETDLGFVGSQNKMLLKIPQGQITVDAKRGQVFLVQGTSVKDLTAFGSGMNKWFTDHLAFEILKYFPEVDTDNHYTGVGLHGTFDSKYERVIITKLDYVPRSKDIKYDALTKEFYIEKELIPGEKIREQVYLTDDTYFCNKSWTVSYSMNTNSWISFHSYIPNFYIAENNFFYSGQNDCCSTIEALVAEVLPEPSTTTTSSTSTTSTSSTSTTSTTTTAFTGCDLEGTVVVYDCNLDGTAEEQTTTTTTTTTVGPVGTWTISNSDCGLGSVNDVGINGVFMGTLEGPSDFPLTSGLYGTKTSPGGVVNGVNLVQLNVSTNLAGTGNCLVISFYFNGELSPSHYFYSSDGSPVQQVYVPIVASDDVAVVVSCAPGSCPPNTTTTTTTAAPLQYTADYTFDVGDTSGSLTIFINEEIWATISGNNFGSFNFYDGDSISFSVTSTPGYEGVNASTNISIDQGVTSLYNEGTCNPTTSTQNSAVVYPTGNVTVNVSAGTC